MTGAGDKLVRLWDLNTETPLHTCEGHKQWIMCLQWSPDGKYLASGAKDGEVRIWNPESATVAPKDKKDKKDKKKEPVAGSTIKAKAVFNGHKKWVTGIAWEPLHLAAVDKWRLVSVSKDEKGKVTIS